MAKIVSIGKPGERSLWAVEMTKTEDHIVESIEEKLKADRDDNEADAQFLSQHHLFDKVQPLVTILRNNPELAERIVTLAMMLGLNEAYQVLEHQSRQAAAQGMPLQTFKQTYGLGSLNVSRKLLGLDDDRPTGSGRLGSSGIGGSQ